MFTIREWIRARRISRKANQLGLVYRWIKLHQLCQTDGIYKTPHNFGPQSFWFKNQTRLAVLFTILEANFENKTLSKRAVSRNSNVSIPTTLSILSDAIDLGLIDDSHQMAQGDLRKIMFVIIDFLSTDEFFLFGEAIRSYHISQQLPIDPRQKRVVEPRQTRVVEN